MKKKEQAKNKIKHAAFEEKEIAKEKLRNKEQEVEAEAKAIYSSFLDQFWLYTGVIFCVVAITYYYYYQNPPVDNYPQSIYRKNEKILTGKVEPLKMEKDINLNTTGLRERKMDVLLSEQEEEEAKKNK